MVAKAKSRKATEAVVGLWYADGEAAGWMVTKDEIEPATYKVVRSEPVKLYPKYKEAFAAAAELATRLDRRVIRTDEDADKRVVFHPPVAPPELTLLPALPPDLFPAAPVGAADAVAAAAG